MSHLYFPLFLLFFLLNRLMSSFLSIFISLLLIICSFLPSSCLFLLPLCPLWFFFVPPPYAFQSVIFRSVPPSFLNISPLPPILLLLPYLPFPVRVHVLASLLPSLLNILSPSLPEGWCILATVTFAHSASALNKFLDKEEDECDWRKLKGRRGVSKDIAHHCNIIIIIINIDITQ